MFIADLAAYGAHRTADLMRRRHLPSQRDTLMQPLPERGKSRRPPMASCEIFDILDTIPGVIDPDRETDDGS